MRQMSSEIMELSQNSDCFIKKEFNVREIIDTIIVSDSEDDFLPKTPRTKRKILGKQNKTSPKKYQPSSINPSSSCNSKISITKHSSIRKSTASKNLHCTDFFAIKKHVNVTIKEEKNIEYLSNIQKNIFELPNSVFNDLPSNSTEIDLVDHKIKLEISDSPPDDLTQIKPLFCEPKLSEIDVIKCETKFDIPLNSFYEPKLSEIDVIKFDTPLNPFCEPKLSEIDVIKCEAKFDIPKNSDIPLNQSQMRLTQIKQSQSKIPDYFQSSKSTKETSILLTQTEADTVAQTKRYTSDSNNKLLQNALNISQWTLKNQNLRNLFTGKEIDLIENLFKLSNQKCTILCLRLFPRIDKWYKMDKLCSNLNLKDDEFNLQDLFQELSEDYLTSDPSTESTNTLLNLLPSEDIKDICVSYKIKCKRVKSVMINKLLEFTSTQTTLGIKKKSCDILREKVIKKFGLCVKLRSVFKDAFYRVHLLYSLANPDLEEISDLYNFINRYQIDSVVNNYCEVSYYKVFEHREDFLRYTNAYILRQNLYKHFEQKNRFSMHAVCQEAYNELLKLLKDFEQIGIDKNKPVYLRRFTASWVYIKMLTFASQHLGKHYSDDACEWLHLLINQDIYCLYKTGHWYIQLALIKDAHKKCYTEAANHIIDGLSNKTISQVARQELSVRGWKVKKHRVPQIIFDELRSLLNPLIELPFERRITGQAVSGNVAGKKLQFVCQTAEGKEYSSVEKTAINYYTSELNYSYGIHCEGQLFNTLFIVFFYDILFELHIPNTFITEIQTYPLDLFSTDFFTNRFDYISKRLNDIKTNWEIKTLCQYFSNTLRKYSARILTLTNFAFDEDSFVVILKCIGQKVLGSVLERLAKDYKQFHSGMPDLFLWNKEELKCAFVEVKSAKDKLSVKQILWIQYLHKFGANVEVCHVLSSGAKSK